MADLEKRKKNGYWEEVKYIPYPGAYLNQERWRDEDDPPPTRHPGGGAVRTFADFGIDLKGKNGIEVKATCPQCSHARKKKSYPCLNVNTEKGFGTAGIATGRVASRKARSGAQTRMRRSSGTFGNPSIPSRFIWTARP